MVNAEETYINGTDYTTFGILSNQTQSSSQSQSQTPTSVYINAPQTNQNPTYTTYSLNSIIPIQLFAEVSPVINLSSNGVISLQTSFSFPFDVYITAIAMEVTNGPVNFYITMGSNSINNQNNPGSIFTSVNFNFAFPFLILLPSNVPINFYAGTTSTNATLHCSINGFKG
ncbi:MAG: hypothetical protein ACP5U0_08085 [Caldisphaera sp.]